MSDLTRDDVIDMLKDIFEEQRNMTDEERQAYYDMLRKKERPTATKSTEVPWWKGE